MFCTSAIYSGKHITTSYDEVVNKDSILLKLTERNLVSDNQKHYW